MGLPPALAYLAPTSVTGRSAAGGTFVLPVGYNVPLALSGTNVASDTTITAFNGLGTPATTFYSPSFPLTSPAIETEANLGGCPPISTTVQTCGNRGTMTLTFPRPVRNPRLHLGGLGGQLTSGTLRANYSVRLAIGSAANGSTPVAATWTELNGNSNFGSTTTTVFSSVVAGNTSCSVATNPAACGTLQINATITSLVLNISMDYVGNVAVSSGELDGFMTLVTVDEDFGDAAASYDPTQAAVHTLSDLTIGGTVTADNVNVQASTTSPNASAAANLDSDDFTWPAMSQGQPSAVTVPLAGASVAGTLCGWVDFDNNGAFATPGERVCQSFAAGATSATLNFSVPLTAIAGNRIGRLRAVYGSTLPGATGRVDSGEVEDAQVQILPVANVSITKTNTPGSGATDQAGDTVTRGTTINYSIVVNNAGPSGANGSVLRDPAPTGVTCTAVTCGSPTGGAVCPAVTVAALQSAAGVTIATFPANSSLTFTLTCTVD